MDEIATFMALSVLLTGLKNLETPNPLETTMGKDYLRRLKEKFGADFTALLALFASVSAANPPDPLAALLASAEFKGKTESMAKQVVNVWMLSMYRVEVLDVDPKKAKTGDDAPAEDAGFFEKGAIWPAINAHPIGFSHSSSGYWVVKP